MDAAAGNSITQEKLLFLLWKKVSAEIMKTWRQTKANSWPQIQAICNILLKAIYFRLADKTHQYGSTILAFAGFYHNTIGKGWVVETFMVP